MSVTLSEKSDYTLKKEVCVWTINEYSHSSLIVYSTAHVNNLTYEVKPTNSHRPCSRSQTDGHRSLQLELPQTHLRNTAGMRQKPRPLIRHHGRTGIRTV